MTTRSRHGGMVLLVVLLVVALAIVLALAFTSSQSTSTGISNNAYDHSRARQIAESGLRIALSYVESNDDWRTAMSQGEWVANELYGGGDYTVVGEDGFDADGDGLVDGDGDLADNATDPLTLTVTGRFNNTAHRVRAVVRPGAGTVSMIAAFDKIKIKDDARVDSYRSAAGPYSAENSGSEAIIDTNAT